MPDTLKFDPLQSYLNVKSENQGSIVLVRVGDFYETFDEDARLVARSLGLVITTQKDNRGVLDMCGFPAWHCKIYTAKLRTVWGNVILVEPKGS